GRLSPVARVVLFVDVLGGIATLAVVLVLRGEARTAPWWAPFALIALTVAGELTYVRLRHGGSTEDLTLFEAAVVVDILVLSPVAAIAVPLGALAIASLLQRRSPIKAAFNIGAYAVATAALVGSYHLIAGDGPQFGARSVLGLSVGALAFAAVNLVLLARVLAVVEGGTAWAVVREGARLSAFMALGNVAVGSVAVAVAGAAPFLLPFSALPAVALTYAYRAAAQEKTERERPTLLLDLSSRLARRLDADELLTSYLDIVRTAFHADVARAVLASPDGGWPVVVETIGEETVRRQATTADVALLHRGSGCGAAYLDSDLPEGWQRCLLAGLEAEDERIGVLLLATRSKGEISRGDATLLTPLASALGVALRGAEHLERLVEETSKLKAVVDHSSDGILVVDDRGHVLVWNPAMAAMTGVSAEEAAGEHFGELLTAVDLDGQRLEPASALQQLTPSSPRLTVELGVIRADGEQRWLRCSHAAIFDGDVLSRDVVIAHDVTRERQVDRLKADFIATVSHELRTPMTPIKGYADLLRRRGEQMTPAKRAECLAVIAERVTHLGRLVEDLLLASRISSPLAPRQSVALEAVDLAVLAARAVADLSHAAQSISVNVPELPVLIACDPMRTVQVITNLLSNAMKYSAAESAIDVSVTAAEDGSAAVVVRDEGRGIPADQLERIFDKFHRVEDPLLMTTSGTGLGLFIARQLAQAMGGDITVESTLGAGATFTLRLPAAPEPAAGPDVEPTHCSAQPQLVGPTSGPAG
ncbi:MAG: ATP-binding protein, partial [Mycobacteriales bacterium]